MKIVSNMLATLLYIVLAAYSSVSLAQTNVSATITALRLANTITGGYLPTSDPIFTQMVSAVTSGNTLSAAQLAANSNYFAQYMARRLAFQMQNPQLDAEATVADNDATTFLVAHFVGTSTTKPSISQIWSDNSTYEITVNGTPNHALNYTSAQIGSLTWSSALVQMPGQNAKTPSGTQTVIPATSVGGYLTLSDRVGDNSFAQYGATAGTNLRMIEGMWEIATGLTLLDVASTQASQDVAPRFVPENDPNFFHGQGQPACISCHGGGMSSIDHGYATVADIFNFDPNLGLTYNASPTTSSMKSLGSNASNRAATLACNSAAAVCNPDSVGVGTAQAWDLSTSWNSNGVLAVMGWTGAMTGNGLNSLGAALGQANIVYTFLTTRVINEVCPMGAFTASDVQTIANAANPNVQPAGTDDIRTIVAMVASNPTCL